MKNHDEHARTPQQAADEVGAALSIFVKPPCSKPDARAMAVAFSGLVSAFCQRHGFNLDELRKDGEQLLAELQAKQAGRNLRATAPTAPGLN